MQLEYDAVMKNKTWELVPYTGQENIVGYKWVFWVKYNPNGTIKRHNGRLVAKGFQQNTGIDFSETYSHVIKVVTVRIMLTIIVHYNWPIRQLDFNNVFLNGQLEENVYMYQLEGFIDSSKPNHICKLKKALYGLK